MKAVSSWVEVEKYKFLYCAGLALYLMYSDFFLIYGKSFKNPRLQEKKRGLLGLMVKDNSGGFARQDWHSLVRYGTGFHTKDETDFDDDKKTHVNIAIFYEFIFLFNYKA